MEVKARVDPCFTLISKWLTTVGSQRYIPGKLYADIATSDHWCRISKCCHLEQKPCTDNYIIVQTFHWYLTVFWWQGACFACGWFRVQSLTYPVLFLCFPLCLWFLSAILNLFYFLFYLFSLLFLNCFCHFPLLASFLIFTLSGLLLSWNFIAQLQYYLQQ